jgi:hypothetical protein
VVGILKIARSGIWVIAMLCVYLLTCNATVNIYGQGAKKVTDSKSSVPEKPLGVLSFPPEEKAFSQTMSVSNRSSVSDPSSSNSTFFLKYNNLGNNHNKAGSTSYNFPGFSNPEPSNMQSVPNSPTYPYYNPFYNHYYSNSFGPYPYPQLTPPAYYYPYPQSSTPFSQSFSSASPTYPWAFPTSSSTSAQQYFLPLPPPYSPPPISLSSPTLDRSEIVKDSPRGSEDSVEREESKMISSWFPSIPASDCEGIFEFTVEGTTNLQAKNLVSGDHKITLKMTSSNRGMIDGQLWVDKKNNNDKGSEFDVERTFNNCRVITASSMPSVGSGQHESSASLLDSLLSDLPDDDYSSDEVPTDKTDETDNNRNTQQQEKSDEDVEGTEREGDNKIAALQ